MRGSSVEVDGIPTGFFEVGGARTGGIPTPRHKAHIDCMPINLENPFANIIRGVEANVLLALCEEQLFQTATAIARDCGRSRSEVRVVLNYLASTEVVTTFQDGGYKFFKLNTKHPLHKEIIDVSKSFLRQGLPRTTHAFDAVNK